MYFSIYASNVLVLAVCFKLINFVFQIFPLFLPGMSTIFMSYIVKIIAIYLAWVLQKHCTLACFLLSNFYTFLCNVDYSALVRNNLYSLWLKLLYCLIVYRPFKIYLYTQFRDPMGLLHGICFVPSRKL
jgi:hypothetical protein